MPSTGLSSDFKSAIERAVVSLLGRRCAVREPLRVDANHVAAATFKDEGDYKLMSDFRTRFPSQYQPHSPLCFEYVAHLSDSIHLKWVVHVTGLELTIEKREKGLYTLHRDRDPVCHDRVMEWLKLHENIILERWLGEWLVGEALQHVGTSSQLNWLWPQLLKLDRSGKFQLLGEKSRPKFKPQRTMWRDNWMSTVSQWLAEGAVMGNLRNDQVSLANAVAIRNGHIYVTRDSVMTSISANIRSLAIDANGKRLPQFGEW